MPIWKWSLTADNNATADPTINFAEGQAPSTLNDSCRAVMAAVAGWRDDISGLLADTGTSTAYVVTTNEGLAATPNDGQMIAFTPAASNGISPTLAVDGGTAFPIQTSPGVEVAAATMVAGTPYTVKFLTASSAWILRDYFANPFNIPLGGILPYAGATAPNSNFAILGGQTYSRSGVTLPLFNLIGTTFGTGDGSSTANLPDLRGRTPFGQDFLVNAALANRITVAGGNFDGTVRGILGVGGAQNHTLLLTESPAHSHTGTTGGSGSLSHTHDSISGQTPIVQGGAGVTTGGAGASAVAGTTGTPNVSLDHTHTVSTNSQGGGGAHTILSPAIILPYIMRII